jgi:hypothetical protein
VLVPGSTTPHGGRRSSGKISIFIEGIIYGELLEPGDQAETGAMESAEAAAQSGPDGADREPWPPDDGWHFAPGLFAYLGARLEIYGQEAKPLKMLAEFRRHRTRDETGESEKHKPPQKKPWDYGLQT